MPTLGNFLWILNWYWRNIINSSAFSLSFWVGTQNIFVCACASSTWTCIWGSNIRLYCGFNKDDVQCTGFQFTKVRLHEIACVGKYVATATGILWKNWGNGLYLRLSCRRRFHVLNIVQPTFTHMHSNFCYKTTATSERETMHKMIGCGDFAYAAIQRNITYFAILFVRRKQKQQNHSTPLYQSTGDASGVHMCPFECCTQEQMQ